MFQVIKELFSGENELVKAGINATDKLIFTEEEKRDWFITVSEAYRPFKKAQRFLGLIFCIPYAFAWFIAFCASFFINVSYQIEILAGPMGYIVGIITGFYFGGGFIESRAVAKQAEKKQ